LNDIPVFAEQAFHHLADEAFIPSSQQPCLLAGTRMHCFGWHLSRACKSTSMDISTSQRQGL